jgi:CarD family transcriptional regulator
LGKILRGGAFMFSQGDKAFYPNHGVGVVEKITKNGEEYFYVIRIVDSGMTVTVPLSKAKEVGLRPIIGKHESEKVFEALQKKSESKNQNYRHHPWNRRQRDYMAKLKTGSIYDTVEVFKELTVLQQHKPLSFGEKKLYDHVKKLLVKELACCINCSEDVIHSKINSLISN